MVTFGDFSVEGGYLNGVVRGYVAGLLKFAHYSTLSQCETLEDVKLLLSSTDYGDFLQDEADKLTTSLIAQKCTEHFVHQFNILYTDAKKPIKELFDFIRYGYMIDNVILLITGALHNRDMEELMEKCHPLGKFEAMGTLCLATNVSELYQAVLVETPLAPYFANCFDSHDLDEMNIEIIRNTLYKAYLEDFYKFADTLDAESSEYLKNMLRVEADRRVLSITMNSFGTELSKDDRLRLFPSFGDLYPVGTARLGKAEDIEMVRSVCDMLPQYRKFFDGTKSVDDQMLEYETLLSKSSFEGISNLAVFYSWVRLKEQEIRNIVWISECVAQQQKDQASNYIPLF